MKILLLVDNYVGFKVVEALTRLDEDIVGIFLHPPEYQNYAEEIISASGLTKEYFHIGNQQWSDEDIERVKMLKPDLILVIFWRFLLPKAFIDIPPLGCMNFHMGLLPYNKGKNPNVWPIIDGTPAGVTIHYIDGKIDNGPIICQREVKIEVYDTAKDLYLKLRETFVELFIDSWKNIKHNKIKSKAQEAGAGTLHYAKDFRKLDEINLSDEYTAKDLINILRARTFDNYPSAYFIHEGKKIYMRLNLECSNE